MSRAADAEFMSRHRDNLLEISEVLAGQKPPTFELFHAQAQLLAEVLRQLEGALEQVEKTKRNAGKRERKLGRQAH